MSVYLRWTSKSVGVGGAGTYSSRGICEYDVDAAEDSKQIWCAVMMH